MMTPAEKIQQAYKNLRTAVGLIGFWLPVALLLGNIWFFSGSSQGSISYYYYTHMRNLLVGGLCAMGVFLLFYVGRDRFDFWFTNAAGILAICVAFCPTHESGTAYTFVNHLHPVFAALLFLVLDVIALYLFTRRTRPDRLFRRSRDDAGGVLGLPTPARRRERSPGHDARTRDGKAIRNACYIACGIIILLGIIAAFITSVLGVGSGTVSLYVLEAIIVMTFGVAWLIKGLWTDRRERGPEESPKKYLWSVLRGSAETYQPPEA